MSAKAPTNQDEAVRVSIPGLVGLARAAEQLPLKAVNIRALQSGAYMSPFKGRGMEFVETRPYQAGDDIRSLDWKVTARTGKAHTKLFREERERPVLLWVDLRQSMFFATRGAFKAVIAARAAALLGWSAAAHGDRLGGLIFSADSHQELKPQSGRVGVLRLIKTLCEHPGWEQDQQSTASQSTHEALARLHNVSRPGSLVFLLSDFRDIDRRAEEHLSHIARHNDVVLIHTSDPLEQALPPAGQYRLSNGLRELQLNTADPVMQQNYQQRYHDRENHLQNLCRRYRMFYLPLATTDNVVDRLQIGLGLKRK